MGAVTGGSTVIAIRSQVVALVVWGATVVGALFLISTSLSIDTPFLATLAVDAVVFTSTGVLIGLRQPDNRIAKLLVLVGPAIVATFGGFAIAALRSDEHGSDDRVAMLAAWLGSMGVFPMFALFALIVLLFPDGRLPSRRWRRVVIALLVLLALGQLTLAIRPGPVEVGLPDNPFGIAHPVVVGLAEVGGPLAAIAAIALLPVAAVALGVRFRRARGVTRQQIKWFLAAATLFGISVPVSFADTLVLGEEADQTVFDVLSTGSLVLLPVAIAIAVLRYRLYAIDRLVSRTLGWAAVTAVVLGVFAVWLLVLQAVLRSVTQGQAVPVALSTLAAAALFQPIRRRVQAVVDRRFDRARVDARQIVDGFAGRLRDELDIDAVVAEIGRVAGTSVRPSMTGVWLRPTVRRAGRLRDS